MSYFKHYWRSRGLEICAVMPNASRACLTKDGKHSAMPGNARLVTL